MNIPSSIDDFKLFRWTLHMPSVTEEVVRLKNVLVR